MVHSDTTIADWVTVLQTTRKDSSSTLTTQCTIYYRSDFREQQCQ